jgi:hypothetical protein
MPVIDVTLQGPRSNLLGSRKETAFSLYFHQRKKRPEVDQPYKESESGFQSCFLAGLTLARPGGCKV